MQLMEIKSFILLCAAAVLGGCGTCVNVGKPLPAWTEGCLDIHAVNSARGECTFFILPDGTTMAVDAGANYGTNPKFANCLPKPDVRTRPEELYAAYMKHFMPGDSLDYFSLTHYHADHMGKFKKDYPMDDAGGYRLYGVSALYGMVPFKTLFDRSWPEYGDSVRMEDTSVAIDDYVTFVKYQNGCGMKCGQLEPGRDDQIVLTKDPYAYPDFKVMCYCNGGVVWNGEAQQDFKVSRENVASAGILLSYGDFDYFTSGDNNGQGMIETMNAAIGKEVEALKCPHHMSNPGQVNTLLDGLNPQVVVTQSFFVREIQPNQENIESQGGRRDLFFTNIDRSLVDARPELYSLCKGMNGHVVIRVLPGGKKFYVYMLKDTDYSYEVLAKYGPYRCK